MRLGFSVHSIEMFKTLRFVSSLTLFTVLAAATPVAQQAPRGGSADDKEMAAYRLTLPVLDKVVTATKNLGAAIKNDPRFQKQQAIRAEIEKLEEKEEPTEAEMQRLEKLNADLEKLEEATTLPDTQTQTLDQMEAAMRKEPLINNALTSAGLTPREYAKFMFAYMSAGMVAGMLESGTIKEVPKELAASVNMDNVKFFQVNKAQIAAFQKAMEALEKK